jgi:hypothetical protein
MGSNKGMKYTKRQREWFSKEKSDLRNLALKIDNIPLIFTDETGRLSQGKILQTLIDYHRGHI